MKKFLFSMALALGAICMPSQASAAEVSSPVVNNIKATTTFHFRRRPPQSNSPPDIVPLPVHGNWLETQYYRGGIPTATPDRLASILLRLPPILYMQYRIPVSNWSKAPWGLSVLARVTSIFTGTDFGGKFSRPLSFLEE